MIHPSFAGSSAGSSAGFITIKAVREAKARLIDQLLSSRLYQRAISTILRDPSGSYHALLVSARSPSASETQRKKAEPTVYDLLRYETAWPELRDSIVKDAAMRRLQPTYCSVAVDREPGKASLWLDWN